MTPTCDAEGHICVVASSPEPGMTTMTGYLCAGVPVDGSLSTGQDAAPVDRSSSTGQDAGGTRVAKGTITSWSCAPATNGFQTTSDYVIGLGGEQHTEMAVQPAQGSAPPQVAWLHTNVWAGGKLLGTYDKDGLHFYFDDPLGTRRAQTDAAGVLEQSCVSLPYGDDLNCSGQPQSDGILYTASLSEPTENHFTGKERDTESGNDYFGARYYSSALGRFLSPDWSAKVEPVPYAKLDDPQSFNLYAYLMNNPLGGVDADGHAGGAQQSGQQSSSPGTSSDKKSDPVLFDPQPPPPPGYTEMEIQHDALKLPHLNNCTEQFFGPGFKFTMKNLPHISVTGDYHAGETDERNVPSNGRATIVMGARSLNYGADYLTLLETFMHETANATAIQRFTDRQVRAAFNVTSWTKGEIRQARADLGPRGNPPSAHQESVHDEWDHDIGQQFEECLTKK